MRSKRPKNLTEEEREILARNAMFPVALDHKLPKVRPPVPKKEKIYSFNFRIPESLKADLEKIAVLEEISVTKLMIKLLKRASQQKLMMMEEEDNKLSSNDTPD